MGVFKWLRRDRLSLSSRRSTNPADDIPEHSVESVDAKADTVGTIRTHEYKRCLAEFQARRLSGNKDDFQTPDNKPRRKSARHSLPISCTKCSNDIADVSFNYEKTSYRNYQKAISRRNSADERVPNIQFLFSNQQVFMPGNVFTRTSYSEVRNSKSSAVSSSKSRECSLVKHQIDFDVEDDAPESPPLYFQNNCLPFEISDFMDATPNKDDSISELKNLKYKIEIPERDNDVVDETSTMVKSEKSEDAKLEEVMDELRHFDEWADEQLRMQSICTSKSDESKCDVSYYGLPVVTSSSIDITEPNPRSWERGHWGIIPVHVRKLNVTLDQVKRRQCVEVNILRKFRHPNIMLLMGLYSDMDNFVHLICERCMGPLYTILHIQGNLLTVQTSVSYASDIASALVYLHMQGYLHTDISSTNIMITQNGVAKLADLKACVRYARTSPSKNSSKHLHGNEVPYVNVEDGKCSSQDCQPLISAKTSETGPLSGVAKAYKEYANSNTFRWHAPELFQPDDSGLVYPCSKTDVYAVCSVLWECCNGTIPWQNLTYSKLIELYLTWQTGLDLPVDLYPDSLRELMHKGLQLNRSERISLCILAQNLERVKCELSEMDDIIIPSSLNQKRSTFSSANWETNSSDADYRASPRIRVASHTAVVHHSTSESSRQEEDNSPDEGVYEVYKGKTSAETSITDEEPVKVRYSNLPQREYSSQCSTPLKKKRMRLKDIGTPGEHLHKSDSTEYCSLFSPKSMNLDITDVKDGPANLNLDITDAVENLEHQNQVLAVKETEEKPHAKLSRTFTPRSYKSLEIQIPAVENLDDIKTFHSTRNDNTPSYKFDIKDYSLPTTPIARSNKLRKNAWLSGEVPTKNQNVQKRIDDGGGRGQLYVKSAPHINLPEKESILDEPIQDKPTSTVESPESANSEFDRYCNMKSGGPLQGEYFPFATSTLERCRSHSWSYRQPAESREFPKTRLTEEVLNNVSVKPLVAIHERWISEANRKNERCISSSEGYRRMGPSVKPASHSVDPLQTSVPQLNKKPRLFRSNVTMSPTSSYTSRKSCQSEQFTTAREKIAQSMSFSSRDPDCHEYNIWSKERSKCMSDMKNLSPRSSLERDEDRQSLPNTKVNSATNTSLDDFIKQLIKKEFYQLLNQTSDENYHDKELVQKGTNNVMDALKSENKSETVKSFSRVKINGNNKPLIEITFNKSGENSLQVLDSCVNVTISDRNPGKTEKPLQTCGEDQSGSKDDLRGSLKRCQAFNSIQEARSTEDLYIDDDLATHMEENFGDMKLIPLHGSLHEVLCEKADDCCLIKVKQENGVDKVYFVCENTDDQSKDAIDGIETDGPKGRDKLVFKRSISVIEERIERFYPQEKKCIVMSSKGKRDVYPKRSKSVGKERDDPEENVHRVNCSRSANGDFEKPNYDQTMKNEVVHLENLMSYDSSSDESLKGQNDVDEFEEIEKKVEEDLASINTSNNCGFLEKISEENLSVVNDDEKSGHNDMSHESGIYRAEIRKTRSCEQLQ